MNLSHILSHPQVTNTYNITDILNRFSSKKSKVVAIQNLQSEIVLLKEEIREIKVRQELDRIVLEQFSTMPDTPNLVSFVSMVSRSKSRA